MKTWVMLDVGPFERYVIAQYYAPVDGKRTRATRAQIRRYISGALASMTRDQVSEMTGRRRATADRLRGVELERPRLAPPTEHQLSLL